MWPYITFRIFFYLLIINTGNGLSSSIQPFTNYQYSIELESNVADLWWTVDDTEREIIFELHVKTTGWIALGISPGRILMRFTLNFLIIMFLLYSWRHERC
jgi:hypothetical protein